MVQAPSQTAGNCENSSNASITVIAPPIFVQVAPPMPIIAVLMGCVGRARRGAG
ncbi:MAG TPA: hypothetical protein VGC62_06965 [Pseudomonas sp.]|uniref:hypothetical protein n=1 Tax=Pseudomonas sp. TaxID=306 RepID=UPI002EDAFBF4